MLILSARVLLGLAVVIFAACEGRSQTVSRLAGEAAPFSQLEGVRLGMRLAQLTDRRPNVQQLEDYLYGESVGEFEVRYTFPFAYPPGAPVRLQQVQALQRYTDVSSAMTTWEERIPELKRRLGAPTECVNSVRMYLESKQVVWLRDGSEVIHSVTYDRAERAGTLREDQRTQLVSLRLRSTSDSASEAPEEEYWEEGEGNQTFSCP